jgi:hypothetical protein
MMFTNAIGVALRARRLVIAIGAIAFYSQRLDAAGAVTADEVRQAWQRHADAIQSIQYEFLQSRSEWIHKDIIANDPFDTPVDPKAKREEITRTGTIRFVKEGEKAALWRQAEQWDHDSDGPHEVTQRYSFDGARNANFSQGKGLGLGMIEAAKTPSDSLNNRVETWALWLAHWPSEQLQRHEGFNIDDLKVTGNEVKYGDAQCVELSLPARNRGASDYFVYVDSSKDFHIVKVVHKYHGAPRRQYDVTYVADEKIGWRVKTCRAELASESKEEPLVITNLAMTCEVNAPIEPAAFQIEFPVGTHVADDGSYFIQEANGLRRKISERQFGAAPPEVKVR